VNNLTASLVGKQSSKAGQDYVVGIAAPIATNDFRTHLPKEAFEGNYPKGLDSPAMGLLCNELLRRGRRVILFTLDPSVTTEAILEGERLKICVGPYTSHRGRKLFSAERTYLTRAILRENPSILHANWTYEFALGAIASGLPHVITAHDAPWNVLRYDFTPYRAVRTILAYMAGRRAQKIVAVSPYVSRHLTLFGFHDKSIDVIPNGMADSRFAHIHKREPNQPITFATVLMGWGARKNGKTAIAAFAKVRKRIPNARMLMFGYDYGPQEAAAIWAREHGIETGIEFVGYLAQHTDVLERLLREVDILVHPALEEAHPMSVVEAMSMGIPVIGGSKSGGVPWTLGDGQYGLLVDVRSPDKVAEAMLRLAEDEPERARLGMAGYEAARTRFHIEQVVDRYEAIYAKLASPPRPNRGEGV
jgi:L-malate glycosyltransferase